MNMMMTNSKDFVALISLFTCVLFFFPTSVLPNEEQCTWRARRDDCTRFESRGSRF